MVCHPGALPVSSTCNNIISLSTVKLFDLPFFVEMFEGYPKPGRSPDDECALLKNRKGFVRLALKNKIPLIPVYCFGGSKTFRRIQLPKVVEKISNLLRISIVIVFGKYGECRVMDREIFAKI